MQDFSVQSSKGTRKECSGVKFVVFKQLILDLIQKNNLLTLQPHLYVKKTLFSWINFSIFNLV